MRFIFKIYQIAAGISMISQFHGFLNLIFRQVFAIWPNRGPVQWTRGLVLAAVICNTFDGTLHNFDIVASDLESFA